MVSYQQCKDLDVEKIIKNFIKKFPSLTRECKNYLNILF